MWLVLMGVVIATVGIGGFTLGLWYVLNSGTDDEAELEAADDASTTSDTGGRPVRHGGITAGERELAGARAGEATDTAGRAAPPPAAR